MMVNNVRAPVPEDKHVRDTTLRFRRPFKWSPLGWDIEKIKPGETVQLPKHIAEIALAEKDTEGNPIAEVVTEEATKDEKPATNTRRGGR